MAEERNFEIAVTLHLTTATQARLAKNAALAGKSLAEYIADVVEVVSQHPPSIEEISRRATEQFVASGMTDNELSEMLEVAKHEMRAERRARRPA